MSQLTAPHHAAHARARVRRLGRAAQLRAGRLRAPVVLRGRSRGGCGAALASVGTLPRAECHSALPSLGLSPAPERRSAPSRRQARPHRARARARGRSLTPSRVAFAFAHREQAFGPRLVSFPRCLAPRETARPLAWRTPSRSCRAGATAAAPQQRHRTEAAASADCPRTSPLRRRRARSSTCAARCDARDTPAEAPIAGPATPNISIDGRRMRPALMRPYLLLRPCRPAARCSRWRCRWRSPRLAALSRWSCAAAPASAFAGAPALHRRLSRLSTRYFRLLPLSDARARCQDAAERGAALAARRRAAEPAGRRRRPAAALAPATAAHAGRDAARGAAAGAAGAPPAAHFAGAPLI